MVAGVNQAESKGKLSANTLMGLNPLKRSRVLKLCQYQNEAGPMEAENKVAQVVLCKSKPCGSLWT